MPGFKGLNSRSLRVFTLTLANIMFCFGGSRGVGAVPNAGRETFIMRPEESARQFSRRIGPPKLTRVRAWDDTSKDTYDNPAYSDANFELDGDPVAALWNKKPVIVAFYPNIGFNQGVVFARAGSDSIYHRFAAGALFENGGEAVVASVFFANADRDPEKEMVILSKCDQYHTEYSGTLHEVLIFDDLSKAKGDSLILLTDAMERIGTSWDAMRKDGGSIGAFKYKNASDVKKILKRLGY